MIEVSLRLATDEDVPRAVRRLEEGGISPDQVEVLTRQPLPASMLPVRASRMSAVGVIGAVLGFGAAVAALVTITLDAHLRTGGMPLIAPLPLGVIIYEMTLLASILAIVLALLLGARLGPGRRVVHHPELAHGQAIVAVTCTDADQAEHARGVLAAVAAAARHALPTLLLLFAPAWASERAAAQTFQQSCAPCHGSRGEGRIGPQLAGRAWAPDPFAARVRRGGRVMPAFSSRELSDAQLRALLGFVSSLPAPTAQEKLAAPSSQAPGAVPFQTTCLVCHGLEGRGAIGPGILNTPLPLDQFQDQVRRGSGIMPPVPASRLSDAQLRQVYAYLHPPLRRPDPGTVAALPSAPDYGSDLFFALALLALLAQVASERRRQLSRQIDAQAAAVRQRFPAVENEPVEVTVF